MGVRYRRYLGWYILMTWEEGGRMIKKQQREARRSPPTSVPTDPGKMGEKLGSLSENPDKQGKGTSQSM